MKKYFAILLIGLALCCTTVMAADYGTLLERLDSRDFSAEKDVAIKTTGPYKGETINPHADTIMFKARTELLDEILAAKDSKEKAAEVNAFIIKGLAGNVQVDTKVWMMEQLTFTGTAKEVPALTALLTNKEQRLVDAAAYALAKIPGPEAQAALEKNAKIPAVKIALTSRNYPLPPLAPNETKMPLGLAKASDEVFSAWMAKYNDLDENGKVQTLASITARGDRKYRDTALAAMKSDSPALKKAGLLALEKLATKEDVELLLSRLADEHDLVIRICGFIVADGFDNALVEQLRKANDPKFFFDLTTILIDRFVDIRAEVFAKTTAADCPNRLAFLQGVTKIVTPEDVPQLVASTVLFPRGKDRDAAENLIANVCNRDATPLIKLLDKYPHAIIYPIMCRTGGDAAKKELAHGLESSDPAVLETALRSLAQWSDASFADKMMQIATSGKYAEGISLALLRGYIRVISLPDDKIGVKMSKDEKLANLKKAFALSKRADEKRLILSRLAANRTDKSLAFAVECAADPQLAEAAYNAIADHAHDTALRMQYRDQMLKAIDLVLNNSKNAKLIERVKIYKGRM